MIESDIITKLEYLPQFELWVSSWYTIHRNDPLFYFMVGAKDTGCLQFPLSIIWSYNW